MMRDLADWMQARSTAEATSSASSMSDCATLCSVLPSQSEFGFDASWADRTYLYSTLTKFLIQRLSKPGVVRLGHIALNWTQRFHLLRCMQTPQSSRCPASMIACAIAKAATRAASLPMAPAMPSWSALYRLLNVRLSFRDVYRFAKSCCFEQRVPRV